jgi:hypothetical protein
MCLAAAIVASQGRGIVMSDDREHDPKDGPLNINEPTETSEPTRRQALGRFAKYTAPAMLALLMSEQMASASPAPA